MGEQIFEWWDEQTRRHPTTKNLKWNETKERNTKKRASLMVLLFVVSYIKLSYLKILQAFIGFYVHLHCSLNGLVQQRKNPTANDFPFAFTRRKNILYSFPFLFPFFVVVVLYWTKIAIVYISSSAKENETLFKIQNKTYDAFINEKKKKIHSGHFNSEMSWLNRVKRIR